jgi:ATP-dependent helicase HrpB
VRLDRLVLFHRPLDALDPDRMAEVLLHGIRRVGAQCLPWNKPARRLQQRIGFLARHGTDWADWPDLSDRALMQDLEGWLAPHILGMKGLRDLKGLNLTAILTGVLDWRMRPLLDELAPTHLTVPSGSRLPVDYSVDPPVLAVRLQELFGLVQTPTVARGRVPLLLHLLSPAGRPAQITQDLAGFWQSGYHQVKKELRGRYPKHHWPDDPRRARPTKRAKSKKAPRRTG